MVRADWRFFFRRSTRDRGSSRKWVNPIFIWETRACGAHGRRWRRSRALIADFIKQPDQAKDRGDAKKNLGRKKDVLVGCRMTD